ncbi:peptidylprolyl isomerase [Hirschia baltica]|uniref:PpiC domain-containing protein n=1 Tax=Hirschia baltica (strain ATCC 49814 / DSM 5838 / IFAM 1418) TaxID=582402 RepID=C6XJT8_HIRBI|nr:peptidylprolyl isomerase [Hirschia baltica]ACT59383.1 hypothetical protein Hbal_1695 [Hirschia baltica ATCC 49814]
MLSIVRRMVRSKLMLVVIGLLIVGLAGMGLPDMFSSSEPRGMISAGDRFIVKRDIDNRIDTYLRSVRESEGRTISRQEAAKAGVIQQILQSVASETALLAFADKEKISASRYAVTDMVVNAPRFKNAVTGEFDDASFKDFARLQGLSVRQLETNLKESFTREYIADAVSTGVNTPDALGKVWITSQSEQREFSYVKIPNDVSDEGILPTDEEVAAFYEENKTAFTQPKRKALSILSISPIDFIGSVEIPETVLKDEYDLRIKEFSSPESREIKEFSSSDRRLVQQAVDEIGAGGDVETVLSSLPDLVVTTKIVTRDQISDEEYAKTAFIVPEDTHFGVFELGEGNWTGAYVDTIYPGTPKPFETVSDQIFTELATVAAEQIFERKQEEMFDFVGGGFNLEEAADALGVPLMKYSAIDAQGRTEEGHLLGGIVFRPDAMETIQSLDFEDEMSEILDDANNGIYVIRLDTVEEGFIPELADVKSLATESYKIYQASQASEKLANDLLDRAKALDDLSEAASELGLDYVKPEQNLNRREAPEGVTRSMAYQLLGAKAGDYVVASEQDGSKTVLHLENVSNLEPEMLETLASSGKRAVSESLEADIQRAFVEAVMEDAKIEVNNNAVSEYIQSMASPQ